MEELRLITNFEVLACIEKRLKEEAGRAEEGEENQTTGHDHELKWLRTAVKEYITESRGGSKQNEHGIRAVIKYIKDQCELTKAEILQIINLKPQSALELQLIVEDIEERLVEEQVQALLEFVGKYL